MGIKKQMKEREKTKLTNEQLQLLNAKIFYKQADMWIEVKKTDAAIKEVYIIMNRIVKEVEKVWQEIADGFDRMSNAIDNIRKNKPELKDELLEILEWEN